MKAQKLHASESEVQAAICHLLDFLGLLYTVSDASRTWTRNGTVGRSKVGRGWPDITGCIEGRLFAFEVKSATGRISNDQAAVIQRLRDAGAFVAVVRSVDDVIFELNGWLPKESKPRQIFDRLRN